MTKLLKLIGIRPDEALPSGLMFLHSFCTGVFLCFFYAMANTVFIKENETQNLPYGILASGILGFAIIKLFSYGQSRLSLIQLYKVSFFSILGLTVLFCAFYADWIPGIVGNEQQFSFVVYSLITSFFVLTGLEFGGLMYRMFDLRQTKRLQNLMTLGEIVASLLGYFSIPILKGSIRDKALLYPILLEIALVGMGLSIAVLFLIAHRFKDKFAQPKRQLKTTKSYNLHLLLKDRYYTFISVMAMFSVIGVYFADFGFMASVKEVAGEDEVPTFVALFYGLVKLGELGMSLIAGRLINQFGLRFGLTVLPVLMGGSLVVAALFGLAHLFSQQSFILGLFIFFALNRMIERSLGKGIDKPSARILFQPLSKEEQIPVQTLVEGTVKQIGLIISGLLLILLTKLGQRSNTETVLSYFSLFYILLMAGWVWVAFQLFNLYRKKLRETLRNAQQGRQEEATNDLQPFGMDVLRQHLSQPDPTFHRASVEILNEINPMAIQNAATNLLTHVQVDDLTHQITVQNIFITEKKLLQAFLEKLAESPVEQVRALALEGLQQLTSTNFVPSFLKPDGSKEFQLLEQVLQGATRQENLLLQLLKSPRRQFRMSAMELASRQENDSILQFKLVEMLNDSETSGASAEVLSAFGDKILDELRRLFNKTDNPAIHLRIIEIYAKIGTPTAQKSLLNQFNHYNQEVQNASIRALASLNFQADKEQRLIVKQEIEEVASTIFWRMACIEDLSMEGQMSELIEALEATQQPYYELIFMLLSFLYRPTSIRLIKQHILERSDNEGRIFALELMENVLEDDLKAFLFPLFEDIPDSARLRKVAQSFPQQTLLPDERLLDILNKSYNRTSLWTKALALQTLEKRQLPQLPMEVFSCLFHPHPLVFEIAARTIHHHQAYQLENFYKKITTSKRQYLERLFNQPSEILVFEKIKYLRSIAIFKQTPIDRLVQWSHFLQQEVVLPQISFPIADNFVYFCVKGKLSAAQRTLLAGDMLLPRTLLATTNTVKNLVALEESLILMVLKATFWEIILSDPATVQALLQWLTFEEKVPV